MVRQQQKQAHPSANLYHRSSVFCAAIVMTTHKFSPPHGGLLSTSKHY